MECVRFHQPSELIVADTPSRVKSFDRDEESLERGAGNRKSIERNRKAPGDRPRGLLRFAAEPDGQPVGGVKSAAPGYHYTMGSPPYLWSHPGRLLAPHPAGGLWSVVPRSHDPYVQSLPKSASENQWVSPGERWGPTSGTVPLRVRKTIPAGERLSRRERTGASREPSR
jgi:hypothetical protein